MFCAVHVIVNRVTIIRVIDFNKNYQYAEICGNN